MNERRLYVFEWWYKKYAKEIYNKGYIEGYLLGHKDGKTKGEVEGYRRGISEAKDGGIHIGKHGVSVFKDDEMRGIKFRFRLKSKIDGSIITICIPLNDRMNGLLQYPIELDKWEVLSIDRYSGLQDKTHKNVYENDFVESERGIHKVVYYLGHFELHRVHKIQFSDFNVIPLSEWFDQCEIIGNVHENPELLGVE